MDASEAEEHLQIVDRILAASNRTLCARGEFFVIWGVAIALVDVVLTQVLRRTWPLGAQWIALGVIAIAIALTIARAQFYKRLPESLSALQREYLNVLLIAIGIAIFVNWLTFNLISPVGQMAVWNIVEAFVLVYIGVHRNPRARVGALVLLTSLAVANFMPQSAGYVLAGGTLAGYAGFGVAELLARD